MVNIADQTSCKSRGVKPIPLANKVGDYITKDQHLLQKDPFVSLFGRGTWRFVEPVQIESPGHSTMLPTANGDEGRTAEIFNTEMRRTEIVINPVANGTSIGFIAGPDIFMRELHLPKPAVAAWLKRNRRKIAKAARVTMTLHPPNASWTSLCVSLVEYFTQNWRTLFIRTGATPSTVALAFKSETNTSAGQWVVLEPMDSNSTISAGQGGLAVISKYLVKALLTQIGWQYLDIWK